MRKRLTTMPPILCVLVLFPALLFAQAKVLRELNVAYPLGGSTSYFWVAYRSGAFEKYGLKLKPIYIRGGVAAVQSLLAKEVLISQLTPGLPLITAKSIENFIANDRVLSTMNLKAADILDLSFLEKLEEERKTKAR